MVFGCTIDSTVGGRHDGERSRRPSIDDRAKGGFLDGFLTGIERVGNKVPHPGIIFFILIGIVIVLSVILSLIGWSATYEAIDPVTHEVVTQTTTVRSLLSADGIRFLFSSIVPNFMNFGAVGVIIVAMVGVGVAEESGLIATLVRKIVEIAPKSIFTFIIVMLGVVSSFAADAGYLVLVPLGAAAFHSLGRHPLAGLAAGFSGVAAVFLVNVFVTPTDALLAEMTNDAIAPRRPDARGHAGRQPLLHDRLVDPDGHRLHRPDREGGRAAPRPLRRRRAGRGTGGADPVAVARPALGGLGAPRLRRRRRPAAGAAGRAAAPSRRPARSSPARRSCPA